MKYAVTVEGGWLAIVEARDRREAEREIRKDWAGRLGIPPSYIEAIARPATDDDLAWHRSMGGHG